jgi:hypothetical protein
MAILPKDLLLGPAFGSALFFIRGLQEFQAVAESAPTSERTADSA